MCSFRLGVIAFVGCSLVIACGYPAPAALVSEAPPAPSMPEGWRATSDESFSAIDIRPIAGRLGGEIAALRNTVYDVEGKRVQLNLIVAADEASAEAIVEALHGMKPADFVLRQGLRIYEFVGKDEAIPEMRAGRAHLENDPDDSAE